MIRKLISCHVFYCYCYYQCKHILALLLAEAMQQYEEITIQDADFAMMLCPESRATEEEDQDEDK